MLEQPEIEPLISHHPLTEIKQLTKPLKLLLRLGKINQSLRFDGIYKTLTAFNN